MLEFNENIESENALGRKQQEVMSNPESDVIYKNLFSDDFDGKVVKVVETPALIIDDSNKIMDDLFKDDFEQTELFEDEALDNSSGEVSEIEEKSIDLNGEYEHNSKFTINGNTYETDDNGTVYKVNSTELTSETKYTIDGVTYMTDDKGRIISCDGNAKQTPEGVRDMKAQEQAGGEDRREGDQGGHILARILGGSKGIENMLAMRGPINQGPYHTMEKEINKALDEGKKVHVHFEIKYDGDSKRPSKITAIYVMDGKETVIKYDNDEGSIDLLDSVENKVGKEQYNDLKQEIIDANKDGANMSIIAVKTECGASEGTKVTVIMRDENSGGPNEKRILFLKEDAE